MRAKFKNPSIRHKYDSSMIAADEEGEGPLCPDGTAAGLRLGPTGTRLVEISERYFAAVEEVHDLFSPPSIGPKVFPAQNGSRRQPRLGPGGLGRASSNKLLGQLGQPPQEPPGQGEATGAFAARAGTGCWDRSRRRRRGAKAGLWGRGGPSAPPCVRVGPRPAHRQLAPATGKAGAGRALCGALGLGALPYAKWLSRGSNPDRPYGPQDFKAAENPGNRKFSQIRWADRCNATGYRLRFSATQTTFAGPRRVKLLYWDQDGLAVWYKRLERGTFALPHVDEETVSVILSATELAMLLGGVDLKRTRKRNRYQIPA
jgi:IS66 Orf2 like protein